MKRIIISTLLLTISLCSNALELGKWTIFTAYNKLTQVVPVGSSVYALSEGKLYSYNTTDETYTEYNTSTYLNDYNDITNIDYNSSSRRLIICYDNGNIDMLKVNNNSVRNITDIIDEQTTHTKTIQSITNYGKYAYITMKWGVVVINTEKDEISTSYRLDNDNECITMSLVTRDSIYVCGYSDIDNYGSNVIGGAINDNLLNHDNWKAITGPQQSDVLQRIIKNQQTRNIYTVQNVKDELCSNVKYPEPVRDSNNRCYWGSNDNNKLVKFLKNDDNTYSEASTPRVPYGPASNNIYRLKFLHNKLYTVGQGWIRDIGSKDNLPGIVQTLNADGRWQLYETPDTKTLKIPYTACNDIAIDPRDTSHVMVGSRDGLYEFLNGKFVKYYNKTNSMIKNISDGIGLQYSLVLGATYDATGNLYILNSFCSNALLEWSAGDTEMTHHPYSRLDNFGDIISFLINPFIDSRGLLWFINTHWYDVSFYCYDPATKKFTTFEPLHNQDGNTIYDTEGTGYLRYINEDKEGNIWIAGTKGIAYVPADAIDVSSKQIYQHKVNRNDGTGLADYLLSTVDASCIIFDKANRMYVGTRNSGVYVISADRNEELHHYDTSNSPIISNYINDLALDHNTGTLYISSNKGLCTLVTDAINIPDNLVKDDIKVYPNPVRPEYSGPITIEGIPLYADIKITTATGIVVHEGRSAAAVYQWDGCDTFGNRCASGVYNILITTSDGEQACLTKIAMVK